MQLSTMTRQEGWASDSNLTEFSRGQPLSAPVLHTPPPTAPPAMIGIPSLFPAPWTTSGNAITPLSSAYPRMRLSLMPLVSLPVHNLNQQSCFRASPPTADTLMRSQQVRYHLLPVLLSPARSCHAITRPKPPVSVSDLQSVLFAFWTQLGEMVGSLKYCPTLSELSLVTLLEIPDWAIFRRSLLGWSATLRSQ